MFMLMGTTWTDCGGVAGDDLLGRDPDRDGHESRFSHFADRVAIRPPAVAATDDGLSAPARVAGISLREEREAIGAGPAISAYNGSGLKRGADMPRTSPWHSAKENHHHDNTKCGPGNEILQHSRIPGTGGRPLCNECAKLDFGTPEKSPPYTRQE